MRRREILGCLFAIVFLWFITLSRLVLDFCTNDLNSVFVHEGCIGMGTLRLSMTTVSTVCLMEVVVGSWFLQKYFLPFLFGHGRWQAFEELKRQKLVGFIAQIVVRGGCTVQLLVILCGGWGTHLTLEGGLFQKFNLKEAYAELTKHHVVASCADAGMNHYDVTAMRAWWFSKFHMVAVHVWELSYIPGLSLESWLHHLFVILVALITTQPDLLSFVAGKPDIQPRIDSIGFSLILGASMNCLVKACVVMYHFSAPRALRQARWMEASIAGACLIQAAFYTILPLIITFVHARDFGPVVLIFMCLLPISFLGFVEIRLILIKMSIARNARRKAYNQTLPTGVEQIQSPLELEQNFERVRSVPALSVERSPSSWNPRQQSNESLVSLGPRSILSFSQLDIIDDGRKEAEC